MPTLLIIPRQSSAPPSVPSTGAFPRNRVAESLGIRWRFPSESGGGMARNMQLLRALAIYLSQYFRLRSIM